MLDFKVIRIQNDHSKINVRENRSGNQEWTIQRHEKTDPTKLIAVCFVTTRSGLYRFNII